MGKLRKVGKKGTIKSQTKVRVAVVWGEQLKGEREETGTDMGSGICSIVLQSPQTAFTAH
jgi:hypothetical protein